MIYRGPEISCYAPIPLGPRPRPAVIPRQTLQAARDVQAAGGEVPPATDAVLNVYDSGFEWPGGTEIHALRVIHVLPKTTSPANKPRIGVANGASARAVLGTVPVEPEPEGSRSFSYVRLVQPVLDRHSVECHRQEGALDLTGTIEGPHGGARTEPGRFGARAARLTPYLDAGHYGVAFSDDEYRRIIVWLDANSDFLGAYEDVEAQQRGEIVWPSLD